MPLKSISKMESVEGGTTGGRAITGLITRVGSPPADLPVDVPITAGAGMRIVAILAIRALVSWTVSRFSGLITALAERVRGTGTTAPMHIAASMSDAAHAPIARRDS